MTAQLCDLSVSLVDNGDDFGALFLHIAEEIQRLLVAEERVRGVRVAGGEDDKWREAIYEGVGAVFELASGIAFGLDVGRFFELQCAFASYGVMNSATEEEECFGGVKSGRERGYFGFPRGRAAAISSGIVWSS